MGHTPHQQIGSDNGSNGERPLEITVRLCPHHSDRWVHLSETVSIRSKHVICSNYKKNYR
jgi:hypothetical protein